MSRKKHKRSPSLGIADTGLSLEKFEPLLEPGEFQKLKQELEKPLQPAIRINLLKSEKGRLVKSLQNIYGWEVKPISFCPSGFRVKSNQQPLSATIEHRMGFFYIQESASMLPGELFDFGGIPHPLILDLAASPGGKTTHLADKTGDQGLIIANDSSHERLKALQIVLQNWGVVNQAVTCFAGERFGSWFPGMFDFVLLDAPCSMQGLRTSESHPMRAISEKEHARLSQRQQNLLVSALKATRIGGQVVYSTCTLSPEENEVVLSAVLKEFPSCFNIGDLRTRLPLPAPALVSYGDQTFPQEVQNGIRLWPHLCSTAGFFAARLDKVAPLTSETDPLDYPTVNSQYFSSIDRKTMTTIIHQIQDAYGFDLIKLQEATNTTLYQHAAEVWMISDRLRQTFPALRVNSTGLRVGKLFAGEIALAHEFVARFGLEFNNGILQISDEQVPAWLSGQDLRPYDVSSFPKGRIVVVKDLLGRNLGRGKVLTNQLKNLLPNRLF